MEIAQPAQGICDGRESDFRGVGVDEPAVAGDEKAGRFTMSLYHFNPSRLARRCKLPQSISKARAVAAQLSL